MRDTEIAYKNVVLIPIAAYDDGLYAAMLIIREPSGLQRASGVLGHFPGREEAHRFALAYGMAEIDDRQYGPGVSLTQPAPGERPLLAMHCAA